MRMLGPIAARSGIPFRVVLANGDVAVDGAAPAFTIVFRTTRAQRRVALQGHVGLLESFFDGDIDIEGDLAQAFRAGFECGSDHVPNPIVRVRNRWHERRFSNRSLAQAKANAIFHYGLGQPFYRLWLDLPAMMYTCAYWKEGTTTLEEAQRNKMDHVCRKVRLSPGETFVDVGSGWGGLLFHALEHYGAFGTGINTTTRRSRRRGPKSRAAASPTSSPSSNAISARSRASTTSCCRSARSSMPDAISCPKSSERMPTR